MRRLIARRAGPLDILDKIDNCIRMQGKQLSPASSYTTGNKLRGHAIKVFDRGLASGAHARVGRGHREAARGQESLLRKVQQSGTTRAG
jgi:hypothetical protein